MPTASANGAAPADEARAASAVSHPRLVKPVPIALDKPRSMVMDFAAMEAFEEGFQEAGYSVVNLGYPSREHPIEELAPLAVEAGVAAGVLVLPAALPSTTRSTRGLPISLPPATTHRMPAMSRPHVSARR